MVVGFWPHPLEATALPNPEQTIPLTLLPSPSQKPQISRPYLPSHARITTVIPLTEANIPMVPSPPLHPRHTQLTHQLFAIHLIWFDYYFLRSILCTI